LGLINTKILILKPNHSKLITYTVPENSENLDSLFEAGAGTIGNYENCSFNSNGFSTLSRKRK
jgi:hypothetical protein